MRSSPTSAAMRRGVFGLLAGAGLTFAAEPGLDMSRLLDMDIEELFNVRVVSATRKEASSATVAAAVYVITQEDLHRSGVTTIPDALRMAPGLQVAQQDANIWAISARGFNSRFANKLLVMIDGRTVYTPLFSGVYWDVQDLLLADVERIEVIRGPGATLWGANAVNGVINIITKQARDTQGTHLLGGAGTEERAFGGVRHGAPIEDWGAYRLYAKYDRRDELESAMGGSAADDGEQWRGGFRGDFGKDGPSAFTLQGDLYEGSVGNTIREPSLRPPFSVLSDRRTDVAGGNALGRWTHALRGDAELQLQTYYDRTERDSPFLREVRDTYDADFQHRFRALDRHGALWGAGYRYTSDDTRETSASFNVEPDSRPTEMLNAFVQDEVSFLDEALRLSAGTKWEHNDYTGSEWQPGARFALTPEPRQTVWGSVARAVRTPSRAEDGFSIDSSTLPPGALGPGTPPALVRLIGNRQFDAEELVAYELGYRVIPVESLSLDFAAFYHDYSSLRTLEPGAPLSGGDPQAPRLVVPLRVDNQMEGETHGLEMAAVLRVRDGWRMEGSYSYLEMDLDPEATSRDTDSERAEGQSPEHRASVRSMLDLPHGFELDAWLRYVDALPALPVDPYVELDVRLGWNLTPRTELSLVGRNLLQSSHQEFEPLVLGGVASEVERSAYIKVTVKL